MRHYCIFILLSALLFACNNYSRERELSDSMYRDSVARSKADSITASTDDPNEDDPGEFSENLTCDDLDDWQSVQQMLKNDPEYSFLFFRESSDHFTIQRDFTGDGNLQTLVFVEAYSASSSGGCSCFIGLYSCDSVARPILKDISGYFNEADIWDLDHDGIPEIISSCSILHMGECHDRYEIFNFKGGKRNFLYQSDSYSYIGCGFDNEEDFFREGDTIGADVQDSLIDPDHDGVYSVYSIRTTKIYNGGGKIDKEIIRNEIKETDTLIIPLKSF